MGDIRDITHGKPVFSLQQIEYLEKLFPEIISPDINAQERVYRAGQRSVLQCIKQVSKVVYVPQHIRSTGI